MSTKQSTNTPSKTNEQLVKEMDEVQQEIKKQTHEERKAMNELKDIMHKDIQKLIKESTKSDDELEAEIHKQTVTIMLSIAAIILTFVWQNTLETAINHYFNVPKNALQMKVIFATVLTIALGIFIYYLNKATSGSIAKGAKA